MDSLHEIAVELVIVLLVGIVACLGRMYFWEKDLHRWHALEDDEGVKVWYVRKSLEESIKTLVLVVERLDRRDAEHVLVQKENVLIQKALTESLDRLAAKLK